MEFFKNARGFSSGRASTQCLFTRGALRASGKITMSNKPGYSETRPHLDGVLQKRIISNNKCILVLFVLKFYFAACDFSVLSADVEILYYVLTGRGRFVLNNRYVLVEGFIVLLIN